MADFIVKILKTKKYKAYILLLVFAFLNIAYNAYDLYSKKNFIGIFSPREQSFQILTNNYFKTEKNLKDKSFYRIDVFAGFFENIGNLSLNMNTKSTQMFYSLMNPYIVDFHDEIENFSYGNITYEGLDNRTMLEALFNVKYIIEISSEVRPYRFDKLIDSNINSLHTKYFVYQNEYFLPFGYTYSYYIPVEIYKNLNAIQKQQALMQGVVLENFISTDFSKLQSLKLSEKTLSLPISDKISISKKNAYLIFSFEDGDSGETYIRLHNLRFLTNTTKANTISFLYSDKIMKGISLYSIKAPWVSDKEDFILNLGMDLYGKDAKNSIALVFGEPGIFSLGSIEMIFLPMGYDYIEQVEALKEDHLENVEEFTNGIRGTVNLKSNKIILFSIPYSKGWTAFVNGKKTKLLRANTMFMALPLKAGFHNIELKYFTPGLKLGMILSIVGFLLFAGICRLEKKDKLKKK
jgi:uncharacterized membrane protein YfhO